MTVVWHVDDLQISHKNGDTVDALINKLIEQYTKEADLTIYRGKVHEYLGMKLDYCEEGKVKIDMKDYLKNILDGLPNKYQGGAITPAANHLFEVNKNMWKLREKNSQTFHTIFDKTAFPVQAGAAGNSDRSSFPHDASERSIKRGRQETIADTKIYQRNEGYSTHPGI